MLRSNHWIIGLVAIVVVQALVLGKLLYSSPDAITEGLSTSLAKKSMSAKVKPSKVTALPGSKLKLVTLTPLAAKRIGLEMGTVGEQHVFRSLVMPGQVTNSAMEAKSASADANITKVSQPEGKRRFVYVKFLGDIELLDLKQSARVSAIGAASGSITAEPIPTSRTAPGKNSAQSHSLRYTIESADDKLAVGSRVRVEIPRAGSKALHKVVPYSAILYDAYGSTWVYVKRGELAFSRQRIEIDFIKDNVAALKSGPELGTPIVTSGSTLLWGTELGK